MKKILLFMMCALMSIGACDAQVAKLSKEMKKACKADVKKYSDWKGAGADSDLDKAMTRCYTYIEDSLNWVVAEAIAQETDISPEYARKKAVAKATELANRRCLLKCREVLRQRHMSKSDVGKRMEKVLTIYKDAKNRKDDGSQALVRVAFKITD